MDNLEDFTEEELRDFIYNKLVNRFKGKKLVSNDNLYITGDVVSPKDIKDYLLNILPRPKVDLKVEFNRETGEILINLEK